MVLDDDKWTYCSYDMFKTQRALFTVQAFVQAQCFWPDKREPVNDLGCSSRERHVDTDLLERRHTHHPHQTRTRIQEETQSEFLKHSFQTENMLL